MVLATPPKGLVQNSGFKYLPSGLSEQLGCFEATRAREQAFFARIAPSRRRLFFCCARPAPGFFLRSLSSFSTSSTSVHSFPRPIPLDLLVGAHRTARARSSSNHSHTTAHNDRPLPHLRHPHPHHTRLRRSDLHPSSHRPRHSPSLIRPARRAARPLRRAQRDRLPPRSAYAGDWDPVWKGDAVEEGPAAASGAEGRGLEGSGAGE